MTTVLKGSTTVTKLNPDWVCELQPLPVDCCQTTLPEVELSINTLVLVTPLTALVVSTTTPLMEGTPAIALAPIDDVAHFTRLTASTDEGIAKHSASTSMALDSMISKAQRLYTKHITAKAMES